MSTEPRPADVVELYLDLMKKVLTRAIVATGHERHTVRPMGRKSTLVHWLNRLSAPLHMEIVRLVSCCANDFLESGHEAGNRPEDSETMLGTRQLDHMQQCVREVLDRKVPGDFLEAGVWRGGMSIFMRAALKAHGVSNRKVWLADSFAGLPPVDTAVEKFAWHSGDMAVSLETVKNNFARYGLLDEQVEFLKGFFCDTLPGAPIPPLAILRIDADLYTSTVDALTHLYPKLSAGGFALFDDYQNLPDCRRAIDEYRQQHGITESIIPIDTRAVYWQRRS